MCPSSPPPSRVCALIAGDKDGVLKVASPLYKHNFALETGACLADPTVVLPTYPVRVHGAQGPDGDEAGGGGGISNVRCRKGEGGEIPNPRRSKGGGFLIPFGRIPGTGAAARRARDSFLSLQKNPRRGGYPDPRCYSWREKEAFEYGEGAPREKEPGVDSEGPGGGQPHRRPPCPSGKGGGGKEPLGEL